MTIALDPHIPRVWRTPNILQFGVEQPVLTLHDLSNAEERMLVALEAGVTMSGLELVSERAGGDPSSIAPFLERVEPVLAPAGGRAAPAPSPSPLVVLDGQGATAVRLAQVLTESGLDARAGLRWNDPVLAHAQAAVIVGSFALDPERHQRWLRRDIPHLAIVFGDRTATIGPFVEPGKSPCLGCVDRRRTDDDPDWPAMACQLSTRPVRHETSLVSSTIASIAAWRVVDRVLDNARSLSARSIAVDYGTGVTTEREHLPHEECGCRALPGTGTADVPLRGRPDFRPGTS
ncbi:TOMM precursor leader peptide-binding protein [Leifsonia sp. NPDC058230]|uniref:TOMM precursor leader peptide-binding protein n=1 Tax=Leifsonia sp. NPDC058230 TaxID=3346391 RepID=UPI0036DE6A0E